MSDRFQLLWQILICPLVWGTVAWAFHNTCVWTYNQAHIICLRCAVACTYMCVFGKKSQGYLWENFTNQLLFRALKKTHIFCLGAFLIKRPFLSNIIWTRVTIGAIASAHLVHDLANMTSWHNRRIGCYRDPHLPNFNEEDLCLIKRFT